MNGQTATVYGAVLGQSGPNGPDTAAVDAGDALLKAALPTMTDMSVIAAGHVVGRLSAPWGASTPVAASGPVTVVGWPGLRLPTTVRVTALSVPLAAGSQVGILRVRQGSHVSEAVLRSTAPLSGPSAFWRLTR